jgi:putative ABC transport system permease protein
MGALWQDIQYGVRILLKSPGFTAVAVLTLALGIGANSAMFSLVDTVMLRSLPVEKPEELVLVATRTKEGDLHSDFSYPLYKTLRDGNDVMSGLFASAGSVFGISSESQTERVRGEYVSANYFSVLGVQPMIGSAFAPSDEAPGAQRAAVISFGLWKRLFGGDPAVLQKTVSLNGRSFSIVGVGPRGFTGIARGLTTDVWIALPHYGEVVNEPGILGMQTHSWLDLAGRLKPGVTAEQAQARMTSQGVPGGFESHFEGTAWQIALTPAEGGNTVFVEELSEPVKLLFVAVALILAIACANIANLLLARSQARQKEMGIRVALGASRFRVVRQLLTESLLLSSLGGGLGLIMALWIGDLSSGIRTRTAGALTLDTSLNSRVFVFTLATSVVTALVFGMIPAIRAARLDLVPILKDGASVTRHSRRRPSLRSLLVVAQVTLSLVLLVGAGLFLRSLWKLQSIDTGFTGDNVLAMSLNLQLQGYSEAKGKNFYPELLSRVTSVPGAQSVSLASALPVTAGGMRIGLPPNATKPPVSEQVSIDDVVVAPRFFETIGLPLLAGREFRLLDTENSTKVIIVNETMARKFWPGMNPVGQTFSTGPDETFEVIGLARDTKYRDLRERPRMTMYQPLAQFYFPSVNVLVRAAGEPSDVLPAIRERLRALDPTLPLFNIRTLPEHIGRSLYVERAQSLLLVVFGALALVLTAIGIYGVIAYTVAQRTREVGLRIALGAQKRDVLMMILKKGLALTLGGIGAGVLGSFWLSQLVASRLYQVSATDPMTFAAVALLLAGVALLACYLPARRATRVDPMIALRYE